MSKKNKLIILSSIFSLAAISCHSIYPFGQGRTSQPISTGAELVPFELQHPAELSPFFKSEQRLEPNEFILKYSRIAEISAPHSEGRASWYGPNFHGSLTANGERFNMHQLTAAHPSLPFGTMVWVENKQNGKGVLVRINDRGPYADNRIIDLSKSAARELGMLGHGVANVQLFVVKKDVHSQNSDHLNTAYTIQLGIFKKGERAFKYASKIKGSRVEIYNEHNQKYYGVFLGKYTDSEAALSMKEKLASRDITGHVKRIEMD